MRGIETGKTRIRHEVFTEIARLAYEGGDYARSLEELPYKICPGDPGREVKVAKATGLSECRKLLLMAKAGKYDGYLLEGMACPGGCVAGAGTLQPIDRSAREVAEFAEKACYSCAYDTEYREYLPLIEE